MNSELELRLQAYLDGELPTREADELKALLAGEPEARALLGELKFTKAALIGNEPEFKLPESREFYWSKIRREIERQERASATRPTVPEMVWWQKWLVPISGLAVAIALLLVFQKKSGPEMALTEVRSGLPEMGAMTFSDQSAGVTMIWVYDRSEGPFTE